MNNLINKVYCQMPFLVRFIGGVSLCESARTSRSSKEPSETEENLLWLSQVTRQDREIADLRLSSSGRDSLLEHCSQYELTVQ